MGTSYKTYTIRPIITVRNELVDVKDFHLENIEIEINDKHWAQKKLYDDIEHTVKTLILPEMEPFKNMMSFQNIKQHVLEYTVRMGSGKYTTPINLMYMFNYSFRLLPSPLKNVDMYFLYIIENCEKELWRLYFLNTTMSRISIR